MCQITSFSFFASISSQLTLPIEIQRPLFTELFQRCAPQKTLSLYHSLALTSRHCNQLLRFEPIILEIFKKLTSCSPFVTPALIAQLTLSPVLVPTQLKLELERTLHDKINCNNPLELSSQKDSWLSWLQTLPKQGLALIESIEFARVVAPEMQAIDATIALLPHLKSIRVQGTKELCHKVIQSIATKQLALETLVMSNSTLAQMTDDHQHPLYEAYFSQILMHSPCLKNLSLFNFQLSYPIFKSLLDHCKQLNEFHLFQSRPLTASEIQELSISCTCLQALTLEGNTSNAQHFLNDNTLILNSSFFRRLLHLSIGYCPYLTNIGLNALCHPDESKLEALILINPGVTQDGLDQLCANSPHLKRLHLVGFIAQNVDQLLPLPQKYPHISFNVY